MSSSTKSDKTKIGNEPVYIGDSIYAQKIHDQQIVMYTSDGIRNRNHVYIQPLEFSQLCEFIEKAWNVNITMQSKGGSR